MYIYILYMEYILKLNHILAYPYISIPIYCIYMAYRYIVYIKSI